MKAFSVPAILVPIALLAACATETETDPAAEGSSELSADEVDLGNAGLTLDIDAGDSSSIMQSQGTAASFDSECVISETAVAGIEFPETLGEFMEAFPAGTALNFQPIYMVDFGSLCARSGGEDAICVIFESYDVEQYDGGIEVIAMGVYSDQCHTAEGVGPGTSIADAATAYGAPRFGFSYDNESREYVSFADAPVAYSFRAESALAETEAGEATAPAGRHGGNYTGVEGDGYFETMVAQPDAELWEIWISTPH